MAAACRFDNENGKRDDTRQQAESMRNAVCDRFAQMVKRFTRFVSCRIPVDNPAAG
jgi:hypothetical protein